MVQSSNGILLLSSLFRRIARELLHSGLLTLTCCKG